MLILALGVRMLVDARVKNIFLMGGVIRLAVCFAGMFILLPFAGADAIRFERMAWIWSADDVSRIVGNIDLSRSYVFSSLIAIIYHFTGREPAIPIFINGIIGIFIVIKSIRLFNIVWGARLRLTGLAIWTLMLMPMLVINSAVVLRENLILLFVVMSMVELTLYIKTNNLIFAAKFILYALFGSFFHGAIIIIALGLPLYVFIYKYKKNLIIKLTIVILFFAALYSLYYYYGFGKLTSIFAEDVAISEVVETLGSAREANTIYVTGWLVPNNMLDVVWQTPIRVLFFLFKPFPWDANSAGTVMASGDALVWLFIAYLMFKNKNYLLKNKMAVGVLLCCFFFLVAFAWGTTNYGTAIRHRAKFFVPLLMLAAPFFPRFRFR